VFWAGIVTYFTYFTYSKAVVVKEQIFPGAGHGVTGDTSPSPSPSGEYARELDGDRTQDTAGSDKTVASSAQKTAERVENEIPRRLNTAHEAQHWRFAGTPVSPPRDDKNRRLNGTTEVVP
jgi:hypothetical protein